MLGYPGLLSEEGAMAVLPDAPTDTRRGFIAKQPLFLVATITQPWAAH
jgi:hypothetical protein